MNTPSFSASSKSSTRGTHLHKLPQFLQKSALAVTAALALSGCEEKKVELGPTLSHANAIERPLYTEKTAKIHYTRDGKNFFGSTKITNLEVTLPPGDHRVTILQMDLNGSDGQDTIEGADIIFSQMYHSTGGEGPIAIKTEPMGATQVFMIISGADLQQTVFFNAEKEITYPKE